MKPYGILKRLAIGDSTLVYLGDTIPFRYTNSAIGSERGLLLVVRNKYNRIEFYPLGEWTDNNQKTSLIARGTFDRKLGVIMHKQWYRINGVDYPLSDGHREVRNDSLIETVEWYHKTGKLRSREISLIRRGYNPKQRDLEKRVEIGTWKYYDEYGNPMKRKRYKRFKFDYE